MPVKTWLPVLAFFVLLVVGIAYCQYGYGADPDYAKSHGTYPNLL
jgi:hypothetical protein